ncbi:radical SAM protein [Ruminococcaceae bacterium OttesenSCG-928-A16]|nr:radical SAM protein [Ruminococcaceae bacterium OttesenSCG-928-A16]
METVPAKTILSRTKAQNMGWFGYEYNMNLYRGCCHGCLYCDSRSSCYHIDDFDTVRAKENALPILRNELARRIKTGVVGTGAMSDPYNPFEKKELLTRHALELLNAYQFGASVATKSNLITRDIDIFTDIKQHSPVLCKITITTPHDDLAAKIEPHAPSSTQRFAALQSLAAAGIFCGVLLMPVLPFLADDPASIELLVKKAAAAGARFIYADFGVTMRDGQREYFLNGLDTAFPLQGYGQKYRTRFGSRYHCASPRAKQLWQIFTAACNKVGLLYNMRDIIAAYRQGYGNRQLSFFN